MAKELQFTKAYNAYIASIRQRNAECQISFRFRAHGNNRVYMLSPDGVKSRVHTWEIHHILPKVNGSTNDVSNLVALSHEEHIVAHFLMNMAIVENPGLCTKKHTKYPFGLKYFFIVKSFIPDILNLRIQACFNHKNEKGTIIGSLLDISRYVCVLQGIDAYDELEMVSCAVNVIKKVFMKNHKLQMAGGGYVSTSLFRES